MPDPTNRQPAPVGKGVTRDSCDSPGVIGQLDASIVRLRGWIKLDGGNSCDDEIHYQLEPDIQEALARGIPLTSILHAGNILHECETDSETKNSLPACKSNGTWWAVAAVPYVKVELSAWNETRARSHPYMRSCVGAAPPVGWTEIDGILGKGCEDPDYPTVHADDRTLWPFDPSQPDPRAARFDNGPSAAARYVEIEGSLLADLSHCGKNSGDLLKMKTFWSRAGFCNSLTDFSDLGRWTEIHPPDRITVLDEPKETYSQWLVAVGSPYADQEFEVELPPRTPAPSATGLVIDYKEDVLVHDHAGEIASSVQATKTGLRVHVSGKKGGTPGFEWLDAPRYLALFRVGWKRCAPKCQIGSCGGDGCGGTCSCASKQTCSAAKTCLPSEGAAECKRRCDQERVTCLVGCERRASSCKTQCAEAHGSCVADCSRD